MVVLKKKTETVARHYLIPHGTFVVPFDMKIMTQPGALEFVRKLIVDNELEGIVFRVGEESTSTSTQSTNAAQVRSKDYYKVNRGHVGVKGDKYKLYLKS